jgi:Sigma-70 region 2
MFKGDARCTKIVVGSLAKSTVGKRRSLVWDTRPGTERISKSAVPQVSSAASDRRSKAELIQRVREGHRTGFEYLYRLHARHVYTVCLRVIGDPTEAEDLTQEAFLLLFRKIHTFRGESAFSAWLQRLAVSVVLEATPDPEDEMLTGWW